MKEFEIPFKLKVVKYKERLESDMEQLLYLTAFLEHMTSFKQKEVFQMTVLMDLLPKYFDFEDPEDIRKICNSSYIRKKHPIIIKNNWMNDYFDKKLSFKHFQLTENLLQYHNKELLFEGQTLDSVKSKIDLEQQIKSNYKRSIGKKIGEGYIKNEALVQAVVFYIRRAELKEYEISNNFTIKKLAQRVEGYRPSLLIIDKVLQKLEDISSFPQANYGEGDPNIRSYFNTTGPTRLEFLQKFLSQSILSGYIGGGYCPDVHKIVYNDNNYSSPYSVIINNMNSFHTINELGMSGTRYLLKEMSHNALIYFQYYALRSNIFVPSSVPRYQDREPIAWKYQNEFDNNYKVSDEWKLLAPATPKSAATPKKKVTKATENDYISQWGSTASTEVIFRSNSRSRGTHITYR